MAATPHRSDVDRLRRAFAGPAAFVALLWLIHGCALVGDWHLGGLGIQPREPAGLVGIVTAPLVHGSASHLLGNTLPLLVIGTAMVLAAPSASRVALPVIWLGSGVAVWLLARDASHLGASGLAFGMLLFVLVGGIMQRDQRSIALVLIVLFLHGSMIWGVLPLREGVSFESHLAGAAIGALCAYGSHRRTGPRPRPRKYAWEGQPIDTEHPAADLFIDRDRPGDD